jgi:hypothetical protein
MLRRNFDLVALLVVVAGLMMIQDAQKLGPRMISAHAAGTLDPARCSLGRIVARLADVRAE